MSQADEPKKVDSDYHAHIDGLRAIAIALVVLFHFELFLPGRGFLGVDVFFVISGFLVGGLVVQQTSASAFNLVDFYRRRITRIFPALIFWSVATLCVGYLIAMPHELEALAGSIFNALTISANNHFYATQNYFGPDKLSSFFLHSWSLSVEEQFYLCFPLIALVGAKFKLRPLLLIAVLFCASIAFYLLTIQADPQRAFYLTHLRAWELLAGTLIAITVKRRGANRARMTLLAMIGLFAIAVGVYLPREVGLGSLGFQLLSVAGTCLLLIANLRAPGNVFAHLLAIPLARWLGQISYSLYLVHWPVITLAGYWAITPLTTVQRLLLIPLSLILAHFSWRFIEKPFRHWGNSVAYWRTKAIPIGLIACFGVLLFARQVAVARGYPGRLSPSELAMINERNHFSPRRKDCHSIEDAVPIPLGNSCLLGATAFKSNWAVWGDSMGVELSFMLAEQLKPYQRGVVQLTSSSCPPLLDVEVPIQPGSKCRDRNDAVREYLRKARSIETVVLIHYYSAYATLPQLNPEGQIKALGRTVNFLLAAGKRVILVGPLPNPRIFVPSAIARKSFYGREIGILDIPLSRFNEESAPYYSRLGQLAQSTNVTAVDASKTLCLADDCPLAINGRALYYDSFHLSLTGAQRLADLIISAAIAKGDLGPE